MATKAIASDAWTRAAVSLKMIRVPSGVNVGCTADPPDAATFVPLTLIDLDGAILLTPRLSVIDKPTAEIVYLRTEAGLSLDELLAGVREQRAQYHADRVKPR
jgi:hypothetical protein